MQPSWGFQTLVNPVTTTGKCCNSGSSAPSRSSTGTVKGAHVTVKLPWGNVTLTGHRDDVLSVEVSRDGSRIVTASKDGYAHLWDARTGDSVWVLRGHGGTVFDASFSPNGRFVVTGGPTTAGVWDTVTRERLYLLQWHEGPVRAAAFSTPTRIVTRGDDGVRTYVCDVCGGLRQLVALAERRLAATSRDLSPAERRRYLGG